MVQHWPGMYEFLASIPSATKIIAIYEDKFCNRQEDPNEF